MGSESSSFKQLAALLQSQALGAKDMDTISPQHSVQQGIQQQVGIVSVIIMGYGVCGSTHTTEMVSVTLSRISGLPEGSAGCSGGWLVDVLGLCKHVVSESAVGPCSTHQAVHFSISVIQTLQMLQR